MTAGTVGFSGYLGGIQTLLERLLKLRGVFQYSGDLKLQLVELFLGKVQPVHGVPGGGRALKMGFFADRTNRISAVLVFRA